jgi:hypothetical protein
MGKYFYLNAQNEQQGPVEAEELKNKGISKDTLVWAAGMAQWAPAGSVEELSPLFVERVAAQAPPPPVPAQPAPTMPPQPAYQPAPQSAPASSSYNKSERSNSAYQTQATTPSPAPTSAPAAAPVSNVAPAASGGKIENNMIWAVLSTVLCCVPIGIYAIICANKVDGLVAQGNIEEATKQAAEAKKWAIIGAAAGFVVILLYSIISIIAAVNG